jgi:hypothetical protein
VSTVLVIAGLLFALVLFAGVLLAALFGLGAFLAWRRDRSKRFDQHADKALNLGSSTVSGVPYVPGTHSDNCCRNVRLDELVADFDWHAAEYEMRSGSGWTSGN